MTDEQELEALAEKLERETQVYLGFRNVSRAAAIRRLLADHRSVSRSLKVARENICETGVACVADPMWDAAAAFRIKQLERTIIEQSAEIKLLTEQRDAVGLFAYEIGAMWVISSTHGFWWRRSQELFKRWSQNKAYGAALEAVRHLFKPVPEQA